MNNKVRKFHSKKLSKHEKNCKIFSKINFCKWSKPVSQEKNSNVCLWKSLFPYIIWEVYLWSKVILQLMGLNRMIRDQVGMCAHCTWKAIVFETIDVLFSIVLAEIAHRRNSVCTTKFPTWIRDLKTFPLRKKAHWYCWKTIQIIYSPWLWFNFLLRRTKACFNLLWLASSLELTLQ